MQGMSGKAAWGVLAVAGALSLGGPAHALSSIDGYTLTSTPAQFAPGASVTFQLKMPAFAGVKTGRYIDWTISQGFPGAGATSKFPMRLPNGLGVFDLHTLTIGGPNERITVTAKVGFSRPPSGAPIFTPPLSKLQLAFIYTCDYPNDGPAPCYYMPSQAYAMRQATKRPPPH